MAIADKFLPERMDSDDRKHISLAVNTDLGFVTATELLEVYPQTHHNMACAATPDRARFVAIFVCALYNRKYFNVTADGRVDPSEENAKKRARDLYMNLCDNHGRGPRPVFLGLLLKWQAEKWFYAWYPEYKYVLEQEGRRCVIPYPYKPPVTKMAKPISNEAVYDHALKQKARSRKQGGRAVV